MNLLIVVGTRPNFIKVTQFKKCVEFYPKINLKIVHTGQHYDKLMTDVFFEQFNLIPDFFLNITPGTANSQMADIMKGLEDLFNNKFMPDLILVVGDVNSTFAAALTANKMGIKLGHIESGLRSFDRTMPEEINRILTDELCDYYFVTEQSGVNNLIAEGKKEESIFFVGNTMIDTLFSFQTEIAKSHILKEYKLLSGHFALMTMHRPSNVDFVDGLVKLMELITMITKKTKLVFPLHPRTLKNLELFGFYNKLIHNENIIFTKPLDYFSFQKLIASCKFILTDSGGIQEETTTKQIPCITIRRNTERPITCQIGTNTLVDFDLNIIEGYLNNILEGTYKIGEVPYLWDGKATNRILEIVNSL